MDSLRKSNGTRGPRRPLKTTFDAKATDADKQKMKDAVATVEKDFKGSSVDKKKAIGHAEFLVRDAVYKRETASA